MSYPAAAIANSFLDIARSEGQDLTPMQIQKLVYFAHGWHLAFNGEALSEESCQAWRWGPVFPVLYHAVKGWGRAPVQDDIFAIRFLEDGGRWISQKTYPRVAGNDPVLAEFFKGIWSEYGHMTGPGLSRITHELNGPWYKVWSESEGAQGAVIPDGLIQNYFKKAIETAEGNG